MSKKDLLDLSLFDDNRKSEMVYRRPQLIRRSDPSIYDKLPVPDSSKELSKANYFTTAAPEYEYRKFSDVELDNPTFSNYGIAAGLILVWTLSNASLIPSYEILTGDTLHCCTQLALIRFTVSLLQLIGEGRSLNITTARLFRCSEAFLLLSATTAFTIIMVHYLQLTAVCLLMNCDSIFIAIMNRQRAALFGLLALPVLYYLNIYMVGLGIGTVLLLTRYNKLALDIAQQTISGFMVLVLFLLISCFNGPMLYIDHWTFISMGSLCINRLITVNFMHYINRHYIRSTIVYCSLKLSTIALAICESSHISLGFFSLVSIAVVNQMICQCAVRDKEERTTLIFNDRS